MAEVPKAREAERDTSTEAKQCTTVDRVSNKRYFERPLKKDIYILYKFACMLYFIYFNMI